MTNTAKTLKTYASYKEFLTFSDLLLERVLEISTRLQLLVKHAYE